MHPQTLQYPHARASNLRKLRPALPLRLQKGVHRSQGDGCRLRLPGGAVDRRRSDSRSGCQRPSPWRHSSRVLRTASSPRWPRRARTLHRGVWQGRSRREGHFAWPWKCGSQLALSWWTGPGLPVEPHPVSTRLICDALWRDPPVCFQVCMPVLVSGRERDSARPLTVDSHPWDRCALVAPAWRRWEQLRPPSGIP